MPWGPVKTSCTTNISYYDLLQTLIKYFLILNSYWLSANVRSGCKFIICLYFASKQALATHNLSGNVLAQFKKLHVVFHFSDLDEKYSRKAGRDRFSSGITVDFKELNHYKPDVKIDYVDESGRNLNPKEAFRQLSHRFHGKGSGKRKQEKRAKKLEQDNVSVLTIMQCKRIFKLNNWYTSDIPMRCVLQIFDGLCKNHPLSVCMHCLLCFLSL